jgi:hypothetical protein
MRERWGAFAVRDHVSSAPFVTDVLLYDRLIIPVPDPNDLLAKPYWEGQKWQPELLEDCLKIRKVKTENQDGLALTVPWDGPKRERFKNQMSLAAGLAAQQRAPETTYYMDPFELTRELIKGEFRPTLPAGVSKAWTVAAYSSADAFRRDVAITNPNRRTQLATVLSYHFFTPIKSDPKHEMLKRAVDLATTPAFRSKRERFYQWQEEIIQEDISNQKAIEELEQRLLEYNEATRKALRDVVAKYVFTVIPITLAMTGAVLAGPATGLVLAAASGLVELSRFWKFDRKMVIANGDLDAAAMVQDARKVLGLN